MTDHINSSWYVTFEMTKTMKLRGWRSPRTTKTFQNELEAKEFARIKYVEGLKINVGTINPHLPKRAIAWRDVHKWLDETRKQETDDPGACNRLVRRNSDDGLSKSVSARYAKAQHLNGRSPNED